MDGWGEISRTVATTPASRGRNPVTALQFDSTSDLLWVGDLAGYASSWTPNLVSYTRFKASLPIKTPRVLQFVNNHRGIFSLLASNVNFNLRSGIPKIVASTTPEVGPLTCMDVATNGDLFVGASSGLHKLDIQRSTSSSTSFGASPDSSLVSDVQTSFIRNSGKFLVLARSDGQLEILDPNSHSLTSIFKAHQGSIFDIDVKGNYAATCGCLYRDQGDVMIDPLVNVFDFRMMKPLAPVAFSAGASFVRFHPKLPNILVVASASGHFQFVDMYDPSRVNINQADRGITNLDLLPSGEYLALSQGANVSLWIYSDNPVFNAYPAPLDQPDHEEPVNSYIDIDDFSSPLSSVGMPYYKEHLLLNYPTELKFTKELAKLPKKIDDSVIPSEQGHLENHYYLLKGGRKKNQPKFISERVSEHLLDLSLDDVFSLKPNANNTPPNCYLPLQIHYLRFGVEDFDFLYFNKTEFSGLENHLDNAYINQLLQLYRYTPGIYNAVIKSLEVEMLPNSNKIILEENNPHGSSVLSSLGYVFDMMKTAKGKNITILNFLNTLLAIAPDLINVDDEKTLTNLELRLLIVRFNKFVLESLCQSSSTLENSCKIVTTTEVVSEFCRFYDCVDSALAFLDVPQRLTLIESLNAAIYSKKHVRCQQCRSKPEFSNYHHLDILSTVKLPNILLISIGFKPVNGWLSQTFHETDLVYNERPHLNKSLKSTRKYELVGYICAISHASDTTVGEHNLIAYIKIENKWYLFNDFLVMEIPKSEVFDILAPWKKPVIAIYSATNEKFQHIDFEKTDKSVLYRDHFAGTIREGYRKEYQLLTTEEAPKPGTLVAIDAEFVALEPEEIEIWGLTGSRHVTKPRKLSLARISVIRGEGLLFGVPFIDDYIVHTCHIDDYLTLFLGIEPGDLDPVHLKKNLVTLQTAYRRLWLLLGIGCTFVGHGLSNDFRTINLAVPQQQIQDTANFYYLPEHKRRLLLKFLAYVLLRENVQTGNHDLIEDARTALFLYKRYLKLKELGEFEQTLQRIYKEGQHTRFKVPDTPSAPPTPTL